MVRQRLTKFAFYRYRYVFAYTAFGVSLAALLLLAGFYLPGGLTQTEIHSMLVSDSLSISHLLNLPPDQLMYLPYRIIQAASIALFGVSVISIKLPSILLGFGSAIGLVYLLNLWYKKNVAIIVAILAVTTTQFLLTSQAGQPGISYIFISVVVLIAASMIARQSAYAKIWALVGFVFAAISLYMPLNIYLLLALVLTALIHPHARYLVFQKSSKSIIGIGMLLALIISLPLIIGIINQPSILKVLFGIPTDFNEFLSNASLLLSNYASFIEPRSSTVIAPIYGLGLVMLIAIGLYRLFTAKYTARSYLISFLLVALVPFVLLNPHLVSITFVPVMLLVALGVDYIISSWYRLFPKNPYARVFGLAPLGILMIGLVLSSVDRYAYGLHYDSAIYSSYSYDLPLLQKKLATLDSDTSVILVATNKNSEFYRSFGVHQRYVDSFTVVSTATNLPKADVIIVERQFAQHSTQVPVEILVTRASSEANRFYVYKNNAS